MPPGRPEGASCVQEFDDSLNSAIRITYRISLRSSSLREPRYPLLRVVQHYVYRIHEPLHGRSQGVSMKHGSVVSMLLKGLKIGLNKIRQNACHSHSPR